ncbi:hypothetical protein [Nonomuraea sp. NPDC050310]|uniref:hypothetical protein n=1 Tax=Nonomuraea sp. NPDC050310 TaxID=3154935 RepID=UPI00340B437F
MELSDGSQSRHIRLKLYIGRCKDTCRAKVRVTNISRSNLFNARLTLSVKVNGKKMGSCTDYIGGINAKRVRWAACTIRTAKLDNYWDRWLDGDLSRWSPYVYAVTNYRYYV